MEIDNLSINLKVNDGNAIQRIQQMADAVSRLASTVKTLDVSRLQEFATGLNAIKSAAPTSTQATNMREFASAISEFTSAISGANITQVSNDMSNLSNAVQGMGTRSVNTLTNAAQAMQNFAQQTRQAVQNTGVAPNPAQTPALPNANNAQQLAQAFHQVNQELANTDEHAVSLRNILSSLGTLVPTRQFRTLTEQADRLRERYNALRQSMNEALMSGRLTPDSRAYERQQRQLEALRNEYDRLIQRQRALAQEGNAFQLNPNFARAYQGVGQAVNGVKQAFSGVGNVVNTVNGYINTFIKKLSGFGAASKKAKKDANSLSDTVKKLAKEVTRLGKMMKLMITRMALRAVIKEVGNGFKSLALHSQEFDNSMSNLINSSKTLGYSFAGMVSPLINALAPALVYIIELLTKAINMINQLFSALTGASTWNKAKKFTGSWSDSIKEANGQAKELKKTVLGFDELNQLQDKKTGGKSGADIQDMFDTMPVDSWAKDLAKKIKDIAKTLFEPIKEAWRKVGEFVKSSWAYAMREVGKLAKDMARDFLKVWQQEATQKIFEAFLETIAWIGIAIGNLARQFREAWNYNETGLHILENIRDIILIIITHIRDMARATAEWAGSLDFKPLLTSVNEFLASLKPVFDAIMGIIEDFYNEVVLKFTKWVIESGLPALIDVFTRFNEEVDWEGLRSKLADLWTHLEPFMETIGEGLIIFIERVTQALAEFINGEEFADFLTKLGEWMDSVTPEDVADAIEKLVKALVGFKLAVTAISILSGAASVIGGIVTAFKGAAAIASGVSSFASAVGGLGTALLPIIAIAAGAALAIYSLVSSFGGFGEVISSIKDGIAEVVENLKGFAEESGLVDAWKELKDAFSDFLETLGGLESAWKVVGTVLGFIVTLIGSYLIPFVKRFIELIADWIQMCSGIIEAWSGVFDVLVGLFTGDGDKIKQGAEKIWEGVKKAFTGGIKFILDLLGGLVDLVLTPFNLIKYYLVGDPIVVDMWEDIKQIFDESIGKVVEFVTNLKDDVVELFENIKADVEQKIEAVEAKLDEWAEKFSELKDDIKDVLKNIKDDFVKCFDDIKTGIKTPINAIIGLIESMVNGLIDGINGLGDKLGSLDFDIPDWVPEIGGKHFEISLPKIDKIKLPRYAQGGFPSENGLFMANSGELVGKFSNGKTAVANNEQIISGIERGVYSAVSAAMANNNGGSAYISNEIVVDGEVIARSITKAQEKMNRRYSPQTV